MSHILLARKIRQIYWYQLIYSCTGIGYHRFTQRGIQVSLNLSTRLPPILIVSNGTQMFPCRFYFIVWPTKSHIRTWWLKHRWWWSWISSGCRWSHTCCLGAVSTGGFSYPFGQRPLFLIRQIDITFSVAPPPVSASYSRMPLLLLPPFTVVAGQLKAHRRLRLTDWGLKA